MENPENEDPLDFLGLVVQVDKRQVFKDGYWD